MFTSKEIRLKKQTNQSAVGKLNYAVEKHEESM